MSGTLDRLLSLRGCSFEYNDDAVAYGKGLPGRRPGLMADEANAFVPTGSAGPTRDTYVSRSARPRRC